MEKQKLFALSIVFRGLYTGFFIIETLTGFSLSFFYSDNFAYWVLSRIADLGTLLFMVIITNQLRQLYIDKRFDRFAKLIFIGFLMTAIMGLFTIIPNQYRMSFEPNFYRFLEIIIISYHVIYWASNFLYLIAWNHIIKVIKEKKNEKLINSCKFIATSLILSIVGVSLFYVIIIVDSMISYYPLYLLDIIFISSVVFIGIVLFLNSLAHVIFGIRYYHTPISESEDPITKKLCVECKNFIPKRSVVCPFCGYLYDKVQDM